MKKILVLLLSMMIVNSTSLLDSFKLNKINKQSEELTERQLQLKEKNEFTIKIFERKFNNRQYLETIRLINNKLHAFHGKDEERLLILKLKSLYELKEYQFVVNLAEKLDSSNDLTGINVAEMHIILARTYLYMNKYTRFKTEISILNKNFSKNQDIKHTIQLLNAWYNLENKNYNQTTRLCETILVETKNLDIGSEAGFILAIVKNKTNNDNNSVFISDIVKHNPDFFIKNNKLVTENIDMFTTKSQLDNNIFILGKTYDFLKPKEDFNTFKKFSLALVEQYKLKEDYPKALEYLKKLRNHIGDLVLLEDLVDTEIFKMQILTGEKTLESILEKTKHDKNKHEYFLIFKLIKDFENNDYPSVVKNFKKYKDISSKVYKTHKIINKHEYLNKVSVTLFKDYLKRLKEKEDTGDYKENFIKSLIGKIIPNPTEFLNDAELEVPFIQTLSNFKEYKLNKRLYENYKKSTNIEILKIITSMFFQNNDVEELIDTSDRVLKITKRENIDHYFDFYEYLVHGYKFNNNKTKLKNITDFVIEKSPVINKQRILGIIDTYYTFLNTGKPFGEYTQNEIEHTIYNYLSVSSKYPEALNNKTNVYYFILANRLFKNKSYNDMKLILDKIEAKDDNERSKLNYFFLEYHKNNKSKKDILLKYIEECKSFDDNEWKPRCVNFK